jgi:hypothetical protein
VSTTLGIGESGRTMREDELGYVKQMGPPGDPGWEQQPPVGCRS